MASLDVLKKNVIIFKRMASSSVISYDIDAKVTLEDNTIETKNIDNITNPSTPRPVRYKSVLPYNKDGMWDTPKDIYFDGEYLVEAFLNGTQLRAINRSYSHQLNRLTLILDRDLTEEDIVEIQYYRDEIRYEHETNEQCEYFVKPIMREAYNMGWHNVIE